MNISDAYNTQNNEKSTLGYNNNNKYSNFPPLMNDGRSLVASYQPESVLNNEIIKQNNIQSNWQYRKFLQTNAKTIMDHNLRESLNDVGYFTKDFSPDSSNGVYRTPYYYNSIYENANEIPNKYQENSDLKTEYLTREQLESRKIAPTLTQEELVRNWGVKINEFFSNSPNY